MLTLLLFTATHPQKPQVFSNHPENLKLDTINMINPQSFSSKGFSEQIKISEQTPTLTGGFLL
jgi:hypothetical protein